MIAIDVLVGAICTLVFVLNELWSDKSESSRLVSKCIDSLHKLIPFVHII